MLSSITMLSLCIIGQIADTGAAPLARPVTAPMRLPDAIPAADAPWQPATDASPAATTDVSNASGKLPERKAADLLVQMLDGAAPGTAGQPLTLLAAVASSPDARQQRAIIDAYWRAVEASVIYRLRQDYAARLAKLRPAAADVPAIGTAIASATASVQDAEVATVAAGHDLALLIQSPADGPLPIPTDRPHAGAYRTMFRELFVGRPAPASAKRLDRTLPLYHQVVERRASAVLACNEAHAATLAAWQAGEATAADVLISARDALRQREAFLASITRYNADIADYAFTVTSPGARPQSLVGMLIKPPYDLGLATAPIADPNLRPAAFNEAPAIGRPSGRFGPTPADASTRPATPGDLPIGLRSMSAGAPPAAAQSPGLLPQSSVEPKALSTPARRSPLDLPAAMPARAVAPVNPQYSGASPMYVRRPTGEENAVGRGGDPFRRAAPARPAGPPMNPPGTKLPMPPSAGVPQTNLDTPTAAGRLATRLYGGSGLSKVGQTQLEGTPLTIAASLPAGAADRRAIIEAYWQVGRRAADCQVLADHVDWIRTLTEQSVANRPRCDVRRLEASLLVTEAARDELKIAWLEAQFRLALQTGRDADSTVLPTTVPCYQRCPLTLDNPLATPTSWPLRRLTATMPSLLKATEAQAGAVAQAEAARLAAFDAAGAGRGTIGTALQAASIQTEQTIAFLGDLTAYNTAIVDYALQVLPPGSSNEQLVAALVVRP